MPIIGSEGAASSKGFGQFAQSGAVNYIEDVFSTQVYTGTDGSRTITNNIDLLGKGGMVWSKSRTTPGGTSPDNIITSAEAGAVNFFGMNATYLVTNSNAANFFTGSAIDAFRSSGYQIASSAYAFNELNVNYVSWTFRQQPKFFDVVTYTASSADQTIPHLLGSVPGCIITKKLNSTSDWFVYHRSLGISQLINLNTTAASSAYNNLWGSSAPTATDFKFSPTAWGSNGDTWVAYLFAHDAGGFGLTGTDNVISCGSFTTDGSGNATVNLGYEPQWVMIKRTDSTSQWFMQDTMRGFTANVNNSVRNLYANLANAEAAANGIGLTSTGFVAQGQVGSGATWVYIAIRRGPMKVPTTGTSVYYAQAIQDVNTSFATGFPVDMAIDRYGFWNDSQVPQTGSFYVYDRLRGSPRNLVTNTTAAETTSQPSFFVATTGFQSNTRLGVGPGDGSLNNNSAFFWTFSRAPGFFDEVCYTGDAGFSANYAHNLTVQPELVISKRRNSTNNWAVAVRIGNNSWVTSNATGGFVLNSTASTVQVTGYDAFFTPTHFGPGYIGGGWESSNILGATYVAYLFASAPGVSKVFSYTGNGSSQTINCGFTGGARFVMVKRTDSTGNWMVVDTARGLVSAGDPTLYLNSTAAEVTGVDWIDPDSSGFIVNQEGTMNANVSSATYIGLAIA